MMSLRGGVRVRSAGLPQLAETSACKVATAPPQSGVHQGRGVAIARKTDGQRRRLSARTARERATGPERGVAPEPPRETARG